MIPVSKLHSVTGNISEVRTGHIINAGKVTLSYADGTQLVSTRVDVDGLFHFDFVPEGEYTLAVVDAKDVTREVLMHPPGWFPPSETKETIIREYGTGRQPLVIKDDVTGLVVPVSAKPAK